MIVLRCVCPQSGEPSYHRIIENPILFVQSAQLLSIRSSRPKEWPTVDAATYGPIGQFASLEVSSDGFRAAETRFVSSGVALTVRNKQS